MLLVELVLPPLTPDDYKEGATRGLEMMASLGITSVQDGMSINLPIGQFFFLRIADCKEPFLVAYNALDRVGKLTAHVRCSMFMLPDLSPEFQVSEIKRQAMAYTSAHLRINTAKVY